MMSKRLLAKRRSSSRNDHMAGIAEIVHYWASRQDECGLGCGRKRRKKNFHRCHIIPRSHGGPNSAENVVLLGARCHRDAPNVNDPSFMWLWLRSRSISFYDTAWIIRGFEEFERLFKRKPFADVDPNISFRMVSDSLKKYRQSAIIHFGEGKPNPATVAWIIAQVEAESPGRKVASLDV